VLVAAFRRDELPAPCEMIRRAELETADEDDRGFHGWTRIPDSEIRVVAQFGEGL
jgi:hypothetical protein